MFYVMQSENIVNTLLSDFPTKIEAEEAAIILSNKHKRDYSVIEGICVCTYKPPKDWYDDISKDGVLCWVSDKSSDSKDTIVLITEYLPANSISYQFKDKKYNYHTFATPVSSVEVDKFLLEV